MSQNVKTATFTRSDKEFVKQIEEYQHKHKMNSFIDAIRKLCADAIKIEEIQKK